MKAEDFLALCLKLLPTAESVASIFIHNPASVNAFSMIVGTVDALTPVAAAIAAQYSGGSAAATPATAEAAAQPNAG